MQSGRSKVFRGQSHPEWHGYHLEVVTSDEKTLEVHFIHPLPGKPNAVPPSPAQALTENNFVILGGVRVQNITIEKAA